MTQYALRLDDICPTMKRQPFETIIATCRQAGVTGILGVVPDNQDPHLTPEPPDPHFWDTIKSLSHKGWIVAQHGYQHTYTTSNSGILGLRLRSEFAGLPYAEQYQKIAAGQRLLEQRLNQPISWWMAPAHSFDQTTCRALTNLHFTHITDGIALYPFQQYGLTWVPHQIWKPERKPLGLWTIGLHLNTITPERLTQTCAFIQQHAHDFHNPDLTPRQHPLNPLFKAYWYAKFYSLKRLT